MIDTGDSEHSWAIDLIDNEDKGEEEGEGFGGEGRMEGKGGGREREMGGERFRGKWGEDRHSGRWTDRKGKGQATGAGRSRTQEDVFREDVLRRRPRSEISPRDTAGWSRHG